MCGRFSFFDVEKIQDRFGTTNQLSITPSWNIAPGSLIPVITRNSPNQVSLMKWGFIPKWATGKTLDSHPINARAEGINLKPTFREAFKKNRCLIPANGYFEWQKVHVSGKEEKHPYYFHLPDDRIIAFAGLYSTWTDTEGNQIPTVVIITTNATAEMASIHNRMPVILNQFDENTWLAKQTPETDLLQLLVPTNTLLFHRISLLVNSITNDNPKLIIPINN